MQEEGFVVAAERAQFGDAGDDALVGVEHVDGAGLGGDLPSPGSPSSRLAVGVDGPTGSSAMTCPVRARVLGVCSERPGSGHNARAGDIEFAVAE